MKIKVDFCVYWHYIRSAMQNKGEHKMNYLARIKEEALSMPKEEAKKYLFKLLSTAGQISHYFYSNPRN